MDLSFYDVDDMLEQNQRNKRKSGGGSGRKRSSSSSYQPRDASFHDDILAEQRQCDKLDLRTKVSQKLLQVHRKYSVDTIQQFLSENADTIKELPYLYEVMTNERHLVVREGEERTIKFDWFDEVKPITMLNKHAYCFFGPDTAAKIGKEKFLYVDPYIPKGKKEFMITQSKTTTTTQWSLYNDDTTSEEKKKGSRRAKKRRRMAEKKEDNFVEIKDDIATVEEVVDEEEEDQSDMLQDMLNNQLEYSSRSDDEEEEYNQTEAPETKNSILSLFKRPKDEGLALVTTTGDYNTTTMMTGTFQPASSPSFNEMTTYFTQLASSMKTLTDATVSAHNREIKAIKECSRKDLEMKEQENKALRKEMHLETQLAVAKARLEDRDRFIEQQQRHAPVKELKRLTAVPSTTKSAPPKKTIIEKQQPHSFPSSFASSQTLITRENLEERLSQMQTAEKQYLMGNGQYSEWAFAHDALQTITYKAQSNFVNVHLSEYYLFRSLLRKLHAELHANNAARYQLTENDQQLLDVGSSPLLESYTLVMMKNLNSNESLFNNPSAEQLNAYYAQLMKESTFALVDPSRRENRMNLSNFMLHYWFTARGLLHNQSVEHTLATEATPVYTVVTLKRQKYTYSQEILERHYPMITCGLNTCISTNLTFNCEISGAGRGHSNPCAFCRDACFDFNGKSTPSHHQLKLCDLLANLSNNEYDILRAVVDCLLDPDYADFAANDFIRVISATSFLRAATPHEIARGHFVEDASHRKLRVNMETLLKMRSQNWNKYTQRLRAVNACRNDFDLSPIAGLVNCFNLSSLKNGHGNLEKILLDAEGKNYFKKKITCKNSAIRNFELQSDGFGDDMHFTLPLNPPHSLLEDMPLMGQHANHNNSFQHFNSQENNHTNENFHWFGSQKPDSVDLDELLLENSKFINHYDDRYVEKRERDTDDLD